MRTQSTALALSLALATATGLFAAGTAAAQSGNVISDTDYGWSKSEGISNVTSTLQGQCMGQGGTPGEVVITQVYFDPCGLVFVTGNISCQ